jgi:hypothetical protein
MTQSLTPQSSNAGPSRVPMECPFDAEFFLVESPGFRGMAYRGPEGKWRNAQTNEELLPVVSLLE